MPATYSYPGVYVEEVPSGVRTITGVSTSDTAFVGYFERGPMYEPVRVTSFPDFERRFGGIRADSEASYAIQQFYRNGGSIAWVVRVADSQSAPEAATLDLEGGSPLGTVLTVAAATPGAWGTRIQVSVEHLQGQADVFNLLVQELSEDGTEAVAAETHLNLSMDQNSARHVKDVIDDESDLIRVTSVGDGQLPAQVGFTSLDGATASDGGVPDAQGLKDGVATLDKIAPFVFNILCIPRAASLQSAAMIDVYTSAAKFCEDNRAFLIVDIPENIRSHGDMGGWLDDVGPQVASRNAAVYFPRLEIPDPLKQSRPRNVAASGTVAGVYARTDSTRGVWKAPAGTEAALRGAALTAKLTDLENGGLNPRGANVLRNFPVFGNVAWGGRTLFGADQRASEWKYIPVRRTALFIEESLYQALKWVVFEPNDEPLWAQIRLNVGAFMQNLFRQGAFQGTSPREAYFVKCDKETTTQNDIDLGIVNILVGFAPLKPAEFVVIKIQQIAGQIQT